MEYIEKKRLQNILRITPTCEIEGLEATERERVFDVVEKEPMLTSARPALQAVL
jgi:hypothetical protein